MKSIIKLALMAIPALATANAAMADKLKPGQYEIGNLQQICLVSGGTWYGVTFSPWSGDWTSKSGSTFIYGNYNSGAGNDTIISAAKGFPSWTEWRDDLSYSTVILPAKIKFIKAACDPQPQVSRAIKLHDNPSQK